MIQQKRRMTKGMRRVVRTEYESIDRHPIRVVSFATDPANIGGLVRVSEAYLVDRLWVAKTPGRATAVGTDKWQPYVVGLEALGEAIQNAKDEDYTVVALEQTDISLPLGAAALPERMCLLVGNEGSGLPKSALAAADIGFEIRQFGFVGSLNVVVASGIALYEWSRLWVPVETRQVLRPGLSPEAFARLYQGTWIFARPPENAGGQNL